MRKIVLSSALVLMFVAAAPAAYADTFTFNFCPGNPSCHADLTEASLSFATIDGTGDVNDYTLTVTFKGTLANVFIDSLDFSAGMELAAVPLLTSVPSGTVAGDWTTLFDKINNGGPSCAGEMTNHLFGCSKSMIGNGPDFAGTNSWVYSVDFLGSSVVGATSGVNLRAIFVDGKGKKVGDIMSPEGHFVSTTTTATPTSGGTPSSGGTPTTGSVPEPAELLLFGTALAMGARRLRRRPS
jgi:hypothetical protein